MNLIALTGFAGCGKDTAASALDGWERVSFAQPLKEMMLKLNPWISSGLRLQEAIKLLGWDRAKRDMPEVRRLLQVFGTDVAREMISDSIWIDFADKKIAAAFAARKHVVITDLRFKNELDLIESYAGHVIRITRPGIGPVNGHASESQQIEADAEITNDGTIPELHAILYGVLDAFGVQTNRPTDKYPIVNRSGQKLRIS